MEVTLTLEALKTDVEPTFVSLNTVSLHCMLCNSWSVVHDRNHVVCDAICVCWRVI